MLEDAMRDLGRFLKFALYAIPIMAVVIIALVIALVVAL